MISRAVLRVVVVATALLAVGCVAPVGASGTSVPKDGATQCVSQCGEMGLGLGAVAIMANHVGCICQPVAPAHAQGANAVAPAGMATILMIEEERRRQEQQQQQASQTQKRR